MKFIEKNPTIYFEDEKFGIEGEYEVFDITSDEEGVFELDVEPVDHNADDEEDVVVNFIFNFKDNFFQAETENGNTYRIEPFGLDVTCEGNDEEKAFYLDELLGYIENYIG